MKIRDLLKMLNEDGWVVDRQKGSHQQFIHPTKPGCVTVAGQGNHDIKEGTLTSILRQAGLKGRDASRRGKGKE